MATLLERPRGMVYFPPAVTTKHVGRKLGCLAELGESGAPGLG